MRPIAGWILSPYTIESPRHRPLEIGYQEATRNQPLTRPQAMKAGKSYRMLLHGKREDPSWRVAGRSVDIRLGHEVTPSPWSLDLDLDARRKSFEIRYLLS
jgi:hypothetical protein